MDERWLVSFADMMTLMFALFMVLFSISSVNTSKFEDLQRSMQEAFSGAVLSGGKAVMETAAGSDAAQAPPEPPLPAMMPLDLAQQAGPAPRTRTLSAAAAARENEDFKRLKARIEALAEEAGLEGKVEAEVRRRGLVVRLLTDDVFFSSGEATLKAGSLRLLTRIGLLIDEEARHPVVVEGYTDSQPIGTARFPSNWELSGARAAAVVRHFGTTGINDQRMSLAGHAAQHPIDTNATPQGRARNRRVEIVLARLNRG
ncbi:MAG: Flagellar motor rotation protein MotB [uncultured Solirubrobacteraceae bacterium]|uniref:Flagellar motor rotation protein MotB n=1 Tax=uncultured Solirubrobacteraceae bacterium TaxID=1162706 RepID=A0A6J4S8A4_9ACTN|nr:MAG: Flagellar motor rotation protein MotB [uncultured Solirubrobacteraceae bacterium]